MLFLLNFQSAYATIAGNNSQISKKNTILLSKIGHTMRLDRFKPKERFELLYRKFSWMPLN